MIDKHYIARIWGYEDDFIQMLKDPHFVESRSVFSLIRNANKLHLN